MTGFTSLRFSSMIIMLVLPSLFTYLTMSKQQSHQIFMCIHQISFKWYFSVNTAKSIGVEILCKQTVFVKICGNCLLTENLHTTKSEEIPTLQAMEATFAIIYLCLLFSVGLNSSIKYVSHDSFKILLYSWIAKNDIILKFPPSHVLIWPSTSIYCNLGCWMCCLYVFNFTLSIVCVCPIYSSSQPLQIMTEIKFLLLILNGTLISNFLLRVLKVCFISFLMYLQQTKLLPQLFVPDFELLGEKKVLHNIHPKFGACRLQLVNLTFLKVFLIRSKVFKFFRTCFIIGKVFRLLGLKAEIKVKIFFFLFYYIS